LNQKFQEKVLARSFVLYRDKLNVLVRKGATTQEEKLIELLDNSITEALFFEQNASNIFREQTAEIPPFQYNFTNQYQFNEE